jgi:hypothetical protein
MGGRETLYARLRYDYDYDMVSYGTLPTCLLACLLGGGDCDEVVSLNRCPASILLL